MKSRERDRERESERVDTLSSRTPLTQSPDNLPHSLVQRNLPQSAVDPPPRTDGYTVWSGDCSVEFRNDCEINYYRWSSDIYYNVGYPVLQLIKIETYLFQSFSFEHNNLMNC